ncbi:MAG: ATP-binding protein [Myxococcota bacterium]
METPGPIEGPDILAPLLQQLPVAVVFLDEQGDVVGQNPAADALQQQMSGLWPPRVQSGAGWYDGHRLIVERVAQGDRAVLIISAPRGPAASSGSLALILDDDGVVLYQNSSLSQMGRSLLGHPLASLVEPEDQMDVVEALAAGSARVRFWIQGATGRRWFLDGRLEDRRADVDIGGWLLTCRDQTRHRETEVQLRNLERRFLRLLEGIPMAVIISTTASPQQYINNRARELMEELQLSSREIHDWLLEGGRTWIAGTDKPYPRRRLPARRAARGEVAVVDDLEVTVENLRVALEISAAPVRDRGGGLLYTITTMRAITARRQMEQKIQQVGRMEAVGQLAGELAHDFNNFLTAIGSYGRLALEALPPENEARDDIEEVLQIAHRAGALTRQLLTVSRRQPMTLQKISLNKLLANMRDLLGRVLGSGVELGYESTADLWAIRADAGMLERVLLNLAINARDAMNGVGRLTVGTENIVLDEENAARLPAAQPGAYAVVWVRDTGVGMTPEIANRVFEPFFTTKPQGKGTGLGLSMVYGVVRQMGGYIRLETHPGAGATFRIALPRYVRPQPGPDRDIITQPLPETTQAMPEPARILLVEDDTQIRQFVHRILAPLGYNVYPVGTPSAFQKAVKSARGDGMAAGFDVWIVDIDLPEMNGIELVKSFDSPQPVLFISGRPPEDVQKLPGSFLAKPFTPRALAAAVWARLNG